MNDTDKLLMMKGREDEGNYVFKKKGLVCYKATCQHGRSNNTQPETRTASKS